MSDQDTEEQEPSIEEILSSIRQIISDDDEEEGGAEDPAAEQEPAEESAPVEEEPDDIVELTEKVEEDIAEPEPEPEMEIAMQDHVEPEPEPEPEPSDDDDSLLTDRAEAAALEGFKELAAKTAIDHISGVTIEQIVREEIRPMLRVWIDQNLPDLMERLVREELDRVARRALDE